MAPGLVTPEKAARGQAAHRRLVAHDRADQRRARRPATRRRSPRGSCGAWSHASTPPRRLVPGLLRRQRHARRGRRGARPPLRADRLQPRGGRDHARAPGAGAGAQRALTCEPWRRVSPRAPPVPPQLQRFNLDDAGLWAIVDPWVNERVFELGERKWNPHAGTILILEGPHIPVEELSMGRGWRTAQREGEDVTERVLAHAREVIAEMDEQAWAWLRRAWWARAWIPVTPARRRLSTRRVRADGTSTATRWRSASRSPRCSAPTPSACSRPGGRSRRELRVLRPARPRTRRTRARARAAVTRLVAAAAVGR